MSNKIKVMAVDDSALVRQTMQDILSADPGIEFIGAASDPFAAAEKMKRQAPDVLILDVEMPRMDGITFLRKIMTQSPIPVIICSTLTQKGAETTLKAMEYGAVDIIEKPKLGTKKFLQESGILLLDAVKAAARVKVSKIRTLRPMQVEKKLSADAVLPSAKSRAMAETTEKVVLIGASTGGTEALQKYLLKMPLDAPGTVIVQHMPEMFTAAFAQRLNQVCHMEVKEAKDGDAVLRGRALIAPGNRHLMLKRSGAKYYVQVKDGPLVSRHRPSVDVLFRSGARYCGRNTVAVIMTGMGDDGAKGMLELHKTGAFCIAQDEKTSVVFGMPQEAIKLNAVDKVVGLDQIPFAVLENAG